VQVINNAGHKLPSGYHARRAYLHVLVTDSNGSIVYENGKLNPDGSIDGVAEDTNPFTFEPHHNIITDATQVQVYEATTADANGDVTHSLLATYNVVVELMYQPFGYGHLQELFSLSSSIDQVDQFRTIYENTTLRAETLDVEFVTVN